MADADAADVDVDADALGTKAWEVDAEAARRNRAVRALLPTIMAAGGLWGLYWSCALGQNCEEAGEREVASFRENAAAEDLTGGGGQTGCIFGFSAHTLDSFDRVSPLSWREDAE